MNEILAIQNLTRRFGGLVAVNEVSFTLDTGEVTALIGPNGAGKSTCFNLLGGALAPSAGKVLFENRDISSLPSHRRARLGIGRTFQIAATFRSMTAEENVETALRAAGMKIDAAPALLDDVGIGGMRARPVTELAYGDVKRLELAMALSQRPKLLLLDEPTAGMAGAERQRIMETVTSLSADAGITLLFTEHDMDTVFGFAERVLVMDQGRLIADGTPDQVRANSQVRDVYLGEEPPGDA